ncbi:Endonuclease/exonuclease/phosphatase [Paraphysoderma sedebokerense]|nr:Endonuclease/exonuclease/phosphatase [Paraphysoderma sedebokerense]
MINFISVAFFILLVSQVQCREIATAHTFSNPRHARPDLGGSAPHTGISIPQIQGARHYSKYVGLPVYNLQGVVTRIVELPNHALVNIQDPTGDSDPRTSDAIVIHIHRSNPIYAATIPRLLAGHLVSVSGKVTEYGYYNPQFSSDRFSLTQTQIEHIQRFDILQANVGIKPLIIPDEFQLQFPKGVVFTENLFENRPDQFLNFEGHKTFDDFRPEERGQDFWETLEGMLVQIKSPVVTQKALRHGFYIAPKSLSQNPNSRGGITLTRSSDGKIDSHPENLCIFGNFLGYGIDVGDALQDIVGVIGFHHDTYGVWPLDTVKLAHRAPVELRPLLPPSHFSKESMKIRAGSSFDIQNDEGRFIKVASYNVENLSAMDAMKKFNGLAKHIVEYLASPDVLGLVEVQDDDGPTASSVISSDHTLHKLTQTILSIGGPKYEWTYINPLMNQEGGIPHGNIRNVLLYRSSVFRVASSPNGPGVSSTPLSIVRPSAESQSASSESQRLVFQHNPARINPSSRAWQSTRVPLVVQMQHIPSGEFMIFIVNHWSSKRGGTPFYSAIQPPVNGGEQKRSLQAKEVREAVEMLTRNDPSAKVFILGDFNEFDFASPLIYLKNGPTASFQPNTTFSTQPLQLRNTLEILPPTERYSYIYNGNAQALDHIIVTENVFNAVVKIDVLHVNTWFGSSEASDHDPVGLIIDTKLWDSDNQTGPKRRILNED